MREDHPMRELSPTTLHTVKATAPVLVQHGLAITTRMYERLFVDPAIKALFDQAAQASGEQPRRLAAAIVAFAQNVDNLPALASAIERMAEKHVRSHVRAEHYPAVAEALLPAIRDVLGEAATDEVLQAWGEAYWFLAYILIARERELYRATEAVSA
jgi:hemoglobin-like flavoprotein